MAASALGLAAKAVIDLNACSDQFHDGVTQTVWLGLGNGDKPGIQSGRLGESSKPQMQARPEDDWPTDSHRNRISPLCRPIPMRRFLVLLILLIPVLPSFGQRVSGLVKTGFALSDPHPFFDTSWRVAPGGGILVQLRGAAFLEVNSMFRSQSYSIRLGPMENPVTPGAPVLIEASGRDRIVDIPMLLRIEPWKGRFRPFASGGYVLRSNSYRSSAQFTEAPGTINYKAHRWQNGFAAGGGVSIPVAQWVSIEPEYRYTRVGRGDTARVSEFLIGVRFGQPRR